MADLHAEKIVQIEKIVMKFKRPRIIGHNARIGTHGDRVTDPIVRIHTTNGLVGVGWSRLEKQQAEAIIGKPVGELFQLPDGVLPSGKILDMPLWDLAAKWHNQPLYQLLGARGSREVELYDGSIYIDDLQASDQQTHDIFHEEVKTGINYGYKNFKIKIGRGGRWMPMAKGLDRDILVIHAVREAAGSEAKIMLDTNNGGTLNSSKETLAQCADVGIYWFEEPFAEDSALCEALKNFIRENNWNTLLADGESWPPHSFFNWVERKFIDVVQHDLRAEGISWWKKIAAQIEPWGARCAPHCWGSVLERYAHAHFAASIPHFELLEAAPADVSGIVLNGWHMRDGKLIVPDTPGTGFDLEPDVIAQGVKAEDGFRI